MLRAERNCTTVAEQNRPIGDDSNGLTLVEKGANIRVVQELPGHSSLNTTQVYLSVTANHLEEAIGLLDE